MNFKYDLQLMVKVAQMYYLDNLKQEIIAKQLQISRSLISLILSEAKDAGIVEVNIRNPLVNNEILANQMKLLFHLEECLIVPTALQDSNTLRKLVAQRAVDFCNLIIQEQNLVGVAWGRTCYEFINYYKSNKFFREISVIPLIGGSCQHAPYYQLNEMVRVLAEKMKGTPYFIHAPALASSSEEKELFMKSSSMQSIIERWGNLDIAVTGVGTLPNFNSADREIYIGEYEIYKPLIENQAVGDICARYFNINGEFIRGDFCEKVIGISIEDLKKIKNAVCIVSGIEKAHSILGALRTGIFRTLISDEQTAKEVIKLNLLKKLLKKE